MKAKQLQNRLLVPCRDSDELHEWVRLFLGYNIPRVSVCECHDPPFDYLVNAYFEPADDMIVWAPRGGGKTRLAAVATLLDLLHKPGVAVRILGGSLEQSLKMWEHLVPDLERLVPDLLQKKQIQSRRLRLKNGSTCAVLTQSQRAVRGLRVQKLRCDEVELFDEDVWEAAQLVTRSSSLPLSVLREGARGESRSASALPAPKLAGSLATRDFCKSRAHRIHPLPCPSPGVPEEGVRGTIEALSTHHRPFGLMGKLLDLAQSQDKPRVVKWCLMDVLQRCPAERDCKTCPLWDDCAGVAKTRCDGFIPIDDAIALKQRVSAECWAAEMMCRKPSVRGCVFPSFDPAVHVWEGSGYGVQGSGERSQNSEKRIQNVKTARHAECERSERSDSPLVLAIDFGFANPFVCLWIRTTGTGERAVVHVIDEYVQQGQPMDVHLAEIAARGHGPVAWAACDPAGNGRNDQTAASNVTLLRRAGYRVRFRASRIVDGVEMIRAALRPAASKISNVGDADIIGRSDCTHDGPACSSSLRSPSQRGVRLFVHPRCTHLIAALRGYRYAETGSELPLKDGEHDHLIDALRYFFVNNTENRVIVSKY